MKVKSLGRVQLSATPWTAAHQAPPSMGFSRLKYWSGVPLPSPKDQFAAAAAAAAAKSLQSCPTLCDPVDGSPPGSPVPGILQQEHCSGLPFPSPSIQTLLYIKQTSRKDLLYGLILSQYSGRT